MRKILLLSDTHSHLDEKVYKYIDSVDEIWHAGDVGVVEVLDKLKKLKPLKAVFGNIDGQDVRSEYPENEIFMCEDVKVFITHIGGYPGRYTIEAKKIIEKERPGLFICGHSHILKVMFDKQNALLHLNPGAAGVHGFHVVKTMLRFAINGTEIKNMEIIELGKRA
ncbi:MAG: metallophosphoesterase family protein [Bacteroidia bacterium]